MSIIDSKLTGRRETTNFFVQLRRYFGVLGALLRREEDARRQAPLQTILGIGEPIILIVVITGGRFLLDRFGAPPMGDSALLFYATGIYCKYAFLYVSRRTKKRIRAVYQRFPIEQRLDHIIVHVILQTLDHLVLGLFVFTFIYFFISTHALPFDFVPVVLGMFAAICMAFGWGVVNLVVTGFFPFWNYVVVAVTRFLIIFSGLFYVPDFLSPHARYLLSFNPMVHAVILFRKGFYPNYPNLVLDTHYLWLWVIGSLAVGLILERVSRRIEPR